MSKGGFLNKDFDYFNFNLVKYNDINCRRTNIVWFYIDVTYRPVKISLLLMSLHSLYIFVQAILMYIYKFQPIYLNSTCTFPIWNKANALQCNSRRPAQADYHSILTDCARRLWRLSLFHPFGILLFSQFSLKRPPPGMFSAATHCVWSHVKTHQQL